MVLFGLGMVGSGNGGFGNDDVEYSAMEIELWRYYRVCIWRFL
jgi:hypothetical protein